jgi:hypothetical protein
MVSQDYLFIALFMTCLLLLAHWGGGLHFRH